MHLHFFNSVILIKSVAIENGSFKACRLNGLILQRKFYGGDQDIIMETVSIEEMKKGE
jgi:hypothetical protein